MSCFLFYFTKCFLPMFKVPSAQNAKQATTLFSCVILKRRFLHTFSSLQRWICETKNTKPQTKHIFFTCFMPLPVFLLLRQWNNKIITLGSCLQDKLAVLVHFPLSTQCEFRIVNAALCAFVVCLFFVIFTAADVKAACGKWANGLTCVWW